MVDSIYFSFFSVGWLVAVLFYITVMGYCFTIKNRSKATFHLGLVFLCGALVSMAYFISRSYYSPLASIHRYFTVLFITGSIIHIIQFFFNFPENKNPLASRIILIATWSIALIITGIFIFKSQTADYVYNFVSHSWDYRLYGLTRMIAAIILFYIAFTVITGFMQAKKKRESAKTIILLVCIYIFISVPAALTNLISADGGMSRELHLLIFICTTVSGYFLFFLIFINRIKDKTTLMAKVTGIGLVIFIIIIMGLSFYACWINEKSFDKIYSRQSYLCLNNKEFCGENIEYITVYSVKNNSFYQSYQKGKTTTSINYNEVKTEFDNALTYEKIRRLKSENFKENLADVLNKSSKYFEGYKRAINEYYNTLPEDEKNPSKKVLNYLRSLERIILYRYNKIKKLPNENFRISLEKYLERGQRKEFIPFKAAIMNHLVDNMQEGKKLKLQILEYLKSFKPPENRNYRQDINNNHYIVFIKAVPEEQKVYEVGYNYKFYRGLLHYYNALIIIFTLVLFGGILILFPLFFRGVILKPVKSINNGLLRVGEGDLGVRVPVFAEDEFGFMSRSFNNMVHEIADSRERLNDHTKDLQFKVKERTEELQASMEELEAVNDNLININKALEDAQRIAVKDMQMAANIQSTFMHREIPETLEWDVSYIYSPMSGVSGDIYDFYTMGNKLVGASIFDVSGHGISSGLITMTAKSLIYRRFISMQDQKLNRVVEEANKDLIEEIVNLDNYITGIILRMNNGTVEYVNAGHSDGIVFRKDKASAKLIAPGKGSIRGMFMGVEAMQEEYKSLKFNLKKDDFILLYTNCLYKSTNKNDQEYGIEGIIKSVNRNNNGSADQILQGIVKDFYAFTGTDKLSDDLTMVLLKRLV